MKVRDLLTDESKWTKSLYARDRDGFATDCDSLTATCWCLDGAMQRCYGLTQDYNLAFVCVARRIKSGVVAWNDAPERTFGEVRALVEELDI